MRQTSWSRLSVATLLALELTACAGRASPSPAVQATYLGGASRTASYPALASLPAGKSIALTSRWSLAAGSTVSGQPVSANQLVYWSSWDGSLHASRVGDGSEAWRADLRRTVASGCDPPAAGPAGTPTLVAEGGASTLYTAGGDGRFFALEARSGRQLWSVRLAQPPAEYVWGSPAYSEGSLFVGVSSFGECAAGRGRLLKLAARDGHVQARFDVVPAGCSGGGIWGSPSVDPSRGLVFVATGDADPCGRPTPYAFALVALRLSDLTPADHWQVPPLEQVEDSDFGSTPTLFSGAERPLQVGAVNKNGRYYLFDAGHLAAGPLWTQQVAVGGSCPYCGDGSIAPSAWNGRSLYVAGGRTELSGQACAGSVRALDPAHRSVLWTACFDSGPVLAAPILAGDVLVVGAGPDLVVIEATTGRRLATFRDPDRRSAFLGSALPLRDTLYVGTANGSLYALTTVAV